MSSIIRSVEVEKLKEEILRKIAMERIEKDRIPLPEFNPSDRTQKIEEALEIEDLGKGVGAIIERNPSFTKVKLVGLKKESK